MAEDLVPTGAPYGQRQETVAAMTAAGVPLQSAPPPPQQVGTGGPMGSPPPSGSLPPPGLPPTGLDLLTGSSPDAFPWLADTPSPAAVSGAPTTFDALAGSVQSEFGRAVLSRLAQNG